MQPEWLVGVTLVGLVVGSFLNVVIYRLPAGRSVLQPGSHCRWCEAPIAWYDNIPICSFVFLRGKCRVCHRAIAWRYPLVEAVTAACFVTLGVLLDGWIPLVVAWTLTAALIATAFIDLDHRIIPDEITLPGIVVGLVVSAVVPTLHGMEMWWQGLGQSALGVLVGGGSLYLTGLLGNVLFRKESMGGGDVKLLAMAGAFLGWKLALLAFFLAPLLAILPGLLVLVTTKSHEIPYGPFLSLALFVTIVAGEPLLERLGIVEVLEIGVPELWRSLRLWLTTT